MALQEKHHELMTFFAFFTINEHIRELCKVISNNPLSYIQIMHIDQADIHNCTALC